MDATTTRLLEGVVEVLLRVVFELVVCGLAYWTGYLVLKGLTMGTVRVAALDTAGTKNRGHRKWYQFDGSLWLKRPGKPAVLKAEGVILAGIVVWVVVGVVVYFSVTGEAPAGPGAVGKG